MAAMDKAGGRGADKVCGLCNSCTGWSHQPVLNLIYAIYYRLEPSVGTKLPLGNLDVGLVFRTFSRY